jgi:hypothetical protein
MKKERISSKLFDRVINAPDGDMLVNVDVRISFSSLPTKGFYAIQSFTIFPNSLKPYFKHYTRVKFFVNKYIYNHLLFLADPTMRDLVYEKEEIYDDLNFAIYYKMKDANMAFDGSLKKDYTISHHSIIIPKAIVINEKDIGKCDFCEARIWTFPVSEATKGLNKLQKCALKMRQVNKKFNSKHICPEWTERNIDEQYKTKKGETK